jgi:hypothetical protein
MSGYIVTITFIGFAPFVGDGPAIACGLAVANAAPQTVETGNGVTSRTTAIDPILCSVPDQMTCLMFVYRYW